MAKSQKVFVVGVGMTKFEKPGRRDNFDYPEMSKEAVSQALEDSSVSYKDVQEAYVGYVYGDSTCGQRALYQFGMTGIPIVNVNNNCATGSTALWLGHNAVQSGKVDCVLALGFEKMERGSLGSKFTDRTNPMDKHVEIMSEKFEISAAPITCQMFGNAGKEHMEKYGTKAEHFAKIAYKNHLHSTRNPRSQFQDKYSLEQIMKSTQMTDCLTKLQCCPTSDGAAAAIIVSERFLKSRGLQKNAVEILAMELTTDLTSTLQRPCSAIKLVGFDMAALAAERAYKKAGVSPKDVQVIELHDCFSANELITYEALGLCPPGKAGQLIDAGDNTYGGRWVVNPSGGLISKGHPLGATGLAQCAELCWQLRGLAEARQVKGAKVALQHNVGLGGATVVGIYRHAFPQSLPAGSPQVTPSSGTPGSNLKSAALFEQMRAVFEGKGGNENKAWVVVLGEKLSVEEQDYAKAKGDCIISVKDDDFIDLSSGKLNAQQAFMKGKVKLSGNMGLAMKLQKLFSLLKEYAPSGTGETGTAAPKGGPQGGAGVAEGYTSTQALLALKKHMENRPDAKDLMAKIGQVKYRICISKTGDKKTSLIWLVDLQSDPNRPQINAFKPTDPAVQKSDCTLTLNDDDLAAILSGKMSAQQAFMKGKLKVGGQMGLVMKFGKLLDSKPSKL